MNYFLYPLILSFFLNLFGVSDNRDVDFSIGAVKENFESLQIKSNGVYTKSGIVYVAVFIDTKKEDIEYLEGTGILRCDYLLRQKFSFMPKKYSLRSKLVKKGLDEDSDIYTYVLAYRLSDVNALKKTPKED